MLALPQVCISLCRAFVLPIPAASKLYLFPSSAPVGRDSVDEEHLRSWLSSLSSRLLRDTHLHVMAHIPLARILRRQDVATAARCHH
ncbi:hypothetical protein BD309DRAFT_953108 [Dichomitus squalens]|nr:hypothetical protein BD309DRAFT_953108 [Dichomitus squalens]